MAVHVKLHQPLPLGRIPDLRLSDIDPADCAVRDGVDGPWQAEALCQDGLVLGGVQEELDIDPGPSVDGLIVVAHEVDL